MQADVCCLLHDAKDQCLQGRSFHTVSGEMVGHLLFPAGGNAAKHEDESMSCGSCVAWYCHLAVHLSGSWIIIDGRCYGHFIKSQCAYFLFRAEVKNLHLEITEHVCQNSRLECHMLHSLLESAFTREREVEADDVISSGRCYILKRMLRAFFTVSGVHFIP